MHSRLCVLLYCMISSKRPRELRLKCLRESFRRLYCLALCTLCKGDDLCHMLQDCRKLKEAIDDLCACLFVCIEMFIKFDATIFMCCIFSGPVINQMANSWPSQNQIEISLTLLIDKKTILEERKYMKNCNKKKIPIKQWIEWICVVCCPIIHIGGIHGWLWWWEWP